MILVTGASGKTGQAILRALGSAHDASVRAFVRRSSQVAAVENLGAADVVVGDMRQRSDMAKALAGVSALYHICPNMQPDEVELGAQTIALAKEANVQRFVYHSVLHPQTQDMPHHWNKLLVEEMLFKSGLSYTILQPAAYMQNVLANWSQIRDEGRYRIPYATQTRMGLVDLHDVAEAAALVLTEPGHEGSIYELATSEWLTQDECARLMTSVVGREVLAESVSRAEWRSDAQRVGMSDYAIETLLKMFDYYEQYGFCGNGFTLSNLLERAPTTFSAFLTRLD